MLEHFDQIDTSCRSEVDVAKIAAERARSIIKVGLLISLILFGVAAAWENWSNIKSAWVWAVAAMTLSGGFWPTVLAGIFFMAVSSWTLDTLAVSLDRRHDGPLSSALKGLLAVSCASVVLWVLSMCAVWGVLASYPSMDAYVLSATILLCAPVAFWLIRFILSWLGQVFP